MKIEGFNIVEKYAEKINIWNELKQCQNNAEGNEIPVVVFQRKKSKKFIAIEISEFFKILKQKFKTEN